MNWSPSPSHEAIVSRELFEQVEERALRNHRRATLEAPKTYVQRNGRRNGRLYALRGRIHCGICGRRMEGSHQKGANWYRCQFVYRRGIAAADAAGHPRVLGIREEIVLEPLFDFLGRRLFGPDRLRLLHDELAVSLASGDDDRVEELDAVARRLVEIDQAVRRQTLRLEEHDDPSHPVIAAAKIRIEELAGQRAALDEQRRQLASRRSDAPQPHEIEALLASIPDLRPHSAATSQPTSRSSSPPST